MTHLTTISYSQGYQQSLNLQVHVCSCLDGVDLTCLPVIRETCAGIFLHKEIFGTPPKNNNQHQKDEYLGIKIAIQILSEGV